jgi:hypothetical protein
LEALASMPTNRAFFSQDWVDRWLAEGRVSLEGDVLALGADGPSFQLSSAVLFRAEVASGDDALKLCGRVKTLAAVRELSGEHAPGSVVIGENAYEVLDGFIGELLPSRETALVEDAGAAALQKLKILQRMSSP